MSALPPTADIRQCAWDVRKVPITDIKRALVVIGTSLVVCEDASSVGALPISRGSHEKAAQRLSHVTAPRGFSAAPMPARMSPSLRAGVLARPPKAPRLLRMSANVVCGTTAVIPPADVFTAGIDFAGTTVFSLGSAAAVLATMGFA